MRYVAGWCRLSDQIIGDFPCADWGGGGGGEVVGYPAFPRPVRVALCSHIGEVRSRTARLGCAGLFPTRQQRPWRRTHGQRHNRRWPSSELEAGDPHATRKGPTPRPQDVTSSPTDADTALFRRRTPYKPSDPRPRAPAFLFLTLPVAPGAGTRTPLWGPVGATEESTAGHTQRAGRREGGGGGGLGGRAGDRWSSYTDTRKPTRRRVGWSATEPKTPSRLAAAVLFGSSLPFLPLISSLVSSSKPILNRNSDTPFCCHCCANTVIMSLYTELSTPVTGSYKQPIGL